MVVQFLHTYFFTWGDEREYKYTDSITESIRNNFTEEEYVKNNLYMKFFELDFCKNDGDRLCITRREDLTYHDTKRQIVI
jgi:hypothetical protein